MLKLYGYWRSSAAYRVRIALNLKGLDYEKISVNIAPSASAQREPLFRKINPQMRVPVLETKTGYLSQSMAILEWLEEVYPETALLPADPFDRASCRAFADTIATDVHPLNNLSVLKVLREDLGANKDQINIWYADWILRGFAALEVAAQARTGDFLFGETPSFAEICLAPQVYNARRYNVDLSPFPALVDIDAACMQLNAFKKAAPHAQPDAN